MVRRRGVSSGKRIMAVDPGETTGWCTGIATPAKFELDAHGEINGRDLLIAGFELAGEPGGIYFEDRAVVYCLMQILYDFRPQVLVVEDFVLRPTGIGSTERSGVSPLRIISMIELWVFDILCEEDHIDVPEVVYQQAGSAKRVVTDERLRALGLYKRGVRHARDAIRHADLYRRGLR